MDDCTPLAARAVLRAHRRERDVEAGEPLLQGVRLGPVRKLDDPIANVEGVGEGARLEAACTSRVQDRQEHLAVTRGRRPQVEVTRWPPGQQRLERTAREEEAGIDVGPQRSCGLATREVDHVPLVEWHQAGGRPATALVTVRRGQVPVLAPEEGALTFSSASLSQSPATKYLVPLARAKREDCVRLAEAVAGQRLSTRELGALCEGFRDGGGKTRALLLTDPLVFLRARAAAATPEPAPKSLGQQLLDDLGALGGIARRVTRRLRDGAARGLLADERAEVRHCAVVRPPRTPARRTPATTRSSGSRCSAADLGTSRLSSPRASHRWPPGTVQRRILRPTSRAPRRDQRHDADLAVVDCS
jgi:hypothetical protein